MPRVRSVPAIILSCALVLAACGSSQGGVADRGSLSPAELKLLLIDHIGQDFSYCDPDLYPVGRGTALENARQHQAAIRRDPAYPAILDHLGIPGGATLTDAQLLRVYDLYKKLAVVELHRTRGGADFSVRLMRETLMGSISDMGQIHETASSPNPFGCPICLARNTRIATPRGFVRVQDVRAGMAVWSTDRAGRRIRAVVVRVGRTPVPPTHEVVRLVLADGRTVLVSPGHPTPDGTPVGELRSGVAFEGSTVASTRRIAYSGGFTYDLLPSGPTGTYFANGILLGSTLSRHMSGSRMMT